MLIPALLAATVAIDWKPGPPLAVGVAGHVAIVENGHFIVIGGTSWDGDKKSWHDEIWRLDGASWSRVGALPTKLAYPAVARVGEAYHLIGGWTDDGTTMQMVRYADSRAEMMKPRLRNPRALAGGAAIGNSVYLIGGVSDPIDFTTASAECLCMDLKATRSRWTSLSPMPSPRGLAATVACGGKIFVFGGMSAESRDLDDVIVFDPATNSWAVGAKLPGARRGACATTLDDSRILIAGGCRNEAPGPRFLDEVLIYDTQRNVFATCTPLPYAASGQQAIVVAQDVYIVGGEDRQRHRTDRVVVGRIPPAWE